MIFLIKKMDILSHYDEKLLLFIAHSIDMEEMSKKTDLNKTTLKILAGFLNWNKLSPSYNEEHFEEMVNWDSLFHAKKMTQCKLKRNLHRVDLKHALKYQVFNETLLRETLKNVTDREVWDIVSGEQALSEKFMIDFFDNLNKDILIRNQYLSSNFIKKYINRLNVELLIQYQTLPDKLLLGNFSIREWQLISRFQNLPTKILKLQNRHIDWDELFTYNRNQDFTVVYKLPYLKSYCHNTSTFERKLYNRSLQLLNATELEMMHHLIRKNRYSVDLSWQPHIHPTHVTDWDIYTKWHPIDVDTVETYKIPKSAYIFHYLPFSFIAHLTDDESLYQKNLHILFTLFRRYHDKIDNAPFTKLKNDLIQSKIESPTLAYFELLLPNIPRKSIESAFDDLDISFFKLTHGIGDVTAKELLIEKKKFTTKSAQNKAILSKLSENQKQALKYTLDLITPMPVENYEIILAYLERQLPVVSINNSKEKNYFKPQLTIINWQSGFPGSIQSESNILHTEVNKDPMKTILRILKPTIVHSLSSGPQRSIVLLKIREIIIKVICYNIEDTQLGCLYLFHKDVYDFIIHNKNRFPTIDIADVSRSLVGKYEPYLSMSDVSYYTP